MLREQLMIKAGLEQAAEVRCYHCTKWGYNCGKVMTSEGMSKCQVVKKFTASYQYCKCFNYVGNGQ